MSDLVGNPEDRFSRVAAYVHKENSIYDVRKFCHRCYITINEPRREKTGLRGFRPGPTQTGLYKLRKELEA